MANRTEDRISQIDALLPQLQCQKCGYNGCRPYAQALVVGQENIDKCVPGGQPTIDALATTLNRPKVPFNDSLKEDTLKKVAAIDLAQCIGCTLCIKACPVDAIVGTNKAQHTVIEDACTGCTLCGPACPVDCIDFNQVDPLEPHWIQQESDASKAQAHDRAQRYAVKQHREQAKHVQKAKVDAAILDKQQIEHNIQAAIARVRQKKRALRDPHDDQAKTQTDL